MTQVHFYDQTCVHVDGYKNIIRFDTEQVMLRCPKQILEIYGQSLRIASFHDTEILVQGKIEGVRWISEGAMVHG